MPRLFSNLLAIKEDFESERVSYELEPLEGVSRQTYFPIDIIKEIEILLNEKKQIIFYGSPGTSKTYFAKSL